MSIPATAHGRRGGGRHLTLQPDQLERVKPGHHQLAAGRGVVAGLADDGFIGKAQGLGIDNFTFSAGVPQPPMNIQVSGTNVLLSWPTIVGLNYQLEYNNNLNSTDWIPLGNSVPGTGTTATLNIGITNAECFFKLVIVP